jgi:hypothetical protein
MSSQPTQMPVSPQVRKDDQERKRARAARTSDLLYFAGAALVTVGAGMHSIRIGLITAGAFLLLMPMLELATSFIRGVRGQRRT